MRFSFWATSQQPWQDIVQLCTTAEKLGYDGIWQADHFMPNTESAEGDCLECFTALAALGALIPRVRLGSIVASTTYRNPGVLAKMVANIDVLSGGRAVLGLGAGWQENEHDAFGLELGSIKERLDRFEEGCQVVNSLLTQDRTTFEGRYYKIHNAPIQPRPVQAKVPLMVGGGGEQRTMKIAAKYADEWNTWGTPDVMRHKYDVLRRHCDAIGRDVGDIHVSTQAMVFMSDDEKYLEGMRSRDVGRAAIVGTPAEIVDVMGEYAKANVDEYVLVDFSVGRLDRKLELLERFAKDVAAHAK